MLIVEATFSFKKFFKSRCSFRVCTLGNFGCNLLVLFIFLLMCPVDAQDSTSLSRTSVSIGESDLQLDFLRLPRVDEIYGLVAEGPAVVTGFNSAASYLGETELSLGAVKALLSEKSWNEYTSRVLSLTGTDSDPKWGDYRAQVRRGSSEYPAIYLGVTEIVELCTRLDTIGKIENTDTGLGMEKLVFRVPSRVEWQFAARSSLKPEGKLEMPHFYGWGSYSQTMRGRIEDIQVKMGDPANANSVASQDLFVSLYDRAMQRDDTKGEAGELLGELLQSSLGLEPNIGRIEDARLYPVVSSQPNPWGFHRMIGNAPEWALFASSLAEVEALWFELKESLLPGGVDVQEVGGKAFGVLMGGGFLSFSNRPDKWREFSINWGSPYDSRASELAPYLVEDCIGEGAAGIEDGGGGLRLLLVRSLDPKWFVRFRKNVLVSSDVNSGTEVFDQTLSIMKELLPENELEKNESIVEVYRSLTVGRSLDNDGFWMRALHHLKPVSQFASANASANTPAKNDEGVAALLALAGNSGSSETSTRVEVSAEADFFKIATELASAEQERNE